MGCSQEAPQSIMPAGCELQEGDVVFRRGGSLASRVVLAADALGHYSHLGIVVDSCGVPMIIHAVPGEPDFEGDPDRVKMDSPERFFSSSFAMIGEVCRPRDAGVARRAAREALAQYRKGVLFDHNYDAADSTRMYCTELVVYAFRKAGRELLSRGPHLVSTPLFKGSCIFPSDVYASDFLRSVCKFESVY